MVSGERDEETVWTRAFWVVFKGYLTSVYCVLIETSSRAAAVQFPFTPSSCLTREESFDKGAGPCSSRIVGLPILAMKPCPGSYHHLTLVFLYENRYNDIYSVCFTRVSYGTNERICVSVFYYGKKCYRQWEWFLSKPLARRDLPSPVSSCSYVHPIKPQRFSWAPNAPHHRVLYDQSVQCCAWQPAWNCVSRAGTENKPGAVEYFKRDPTPTSLK